MDNFVSVLFFMKFMILIWPNTHTEFITELGLMKWVFIFFIWILFLQENFIFGKIINKSPLQSCLPFHILLFFQHFWDLFKKLSFNFFLCTWLVPVIKISFDLLKLFLLIKFHLFIFNLHLLCFNMLLDDLLLNKVEGENIFSQFAFMFHELKGRDVWNC